MPDHSDFNEEEMDAINTLRERMKGEVEPEMYDDTYMFLRFLRARDFNIDNAETMLRKTLLWMEKNDIKNILKFKKSEIMEKYCPYSKIGYDKEGCVIRYFDGGNMDLRGFIASVPPKDIDKLIYYETERDTEDLKQQSLKMGQNIDKCVYIYDFKNFSFGTATDKKVIYVGMTLLNMFVNNYPERLKKAFLLNVNGFFNIFFSMIKTLLPKTILEKIQLYSDDSYKEELLKLIDADVLPAFLGGNRTDPDGNELCLTFVKRGEPVPKSLYMSEAKEALAKAPDVKKINLSRAAFKEVNIEVKEPGSFIEWEFETKNRDIGFGLFYQEAVNGEEKIMEIVSIQRIDTEDYPEIGTYKCDKAGVYVIVFDNTYSWVRAKDLYYRIKVVNPNETKRIEENGKDSNKENI